MIAGNETLRACANKSNIQAKIDLNIVWHYIAQTNGCQADEREVECVKEAHA